MKVIYEITDDEEDKFNLRIHKYAENFYIGLSKIDNLIRQVKKEHIKLNQHDLIDQLFDILSESNFHEVN